jgi:AcrR family transcriptional regulator
MATPSRGIDRRAQRTRQMLRQAFLEVAQEKGMLTTSIQDITERANVSRGTFYAHYADKYALIDAVVREHFRHAVSTFPLRCESKTRAFYLLIQTVLEYFKQTYQSHHLSPDIAVLVDRAIHDELYELILRWLQHNPDKKGGDVSLETLAQIISWAIFGAAVQWSQERTTLSSEQMASNVLLSLREIARLTSNESPA